MPSNANSMHTCPATKISYIGTCPIRNCPAHLAKLTRNLKQGCYFDMSNSTSLADVIEVLGITTKQANNDYNAGIRELERVILPIVELHVDKDACDHCGWVKCKGGTICEEQSVTATKALMKYPLNIPEFKVTKAMVWKLAEKQLKTGEDNGILDQKILAFYKARVMKMGKK